MPILTEKQVAAVQAHLAMAGIKAPLREELLDHLCCAIEERMERGQDFETALPDCLHSWPIRHLKKLQTNILITTKLKPMLVRFTATAAAMAGLVFLSPFSLPPDAPMERDEVSFLLENEYLLEEAFVFEPPTGSPIPGVDLKNPDKTLTSTFGMRMHPIFKQKRLHTGIDLKADIGTPVVATANGKVVFAGENGDYGICVRILHDDGYVTVYSHLHQHDVIRGEEVTQGQKIAAVGNTGKSMGPHLHYEVLKDDVPMDPLALLEE
ncbi:M23 family metallopeptidase [Lewinella sp. W8]|uniref:M23 family metallopeptidase n=1 Tax=Lewinella sp. W8 TaxID=2528208 RepID=UPI001068B81D|nr:M23 family metallopeptidase [Lewinella sp. W8]MTB50555.1 peptidoglycan DD-metalloendopeptidase family protein [Lewinella sp. W8]